LIIIDHSASPSIATTIFDILQEMMKPGCLQVCPYNY
jgi:hypothetical protein